MSLADELLADLDEENDTQEVKIDFSDLAEAGKDITTEDLTARLDFEQLNPQQSTLLSRLEPILSRISEVNSLEDDLSSNIEENPVYQLLVEANEYTVEIDNEILVLHKLVKELYSKRFEELSSLVLDPIEYVHTVKMIGNKVKELDSVDLKSFLSGATNMVLTMSAFENKGTDLSPQEMNRLMEACEVIIMLDKAKGIITEFVSSKLNVFAPNLTQIISSHTAAQLLGFSGGLLGLSKTPASNIPSLGAKRQIGIGFGHLGMRRQGFLYHSEIVQNVPPDKRTQAMRIVSGKIVLAARVDLVHSNRDGSQGLLWRKNINDRIEKLVEPPENKGTKALPIPEDKPSKKRGGRRIRKWKEQFRPTELQRAANRMAFGKEEEEITSFDETIGLGMASGQNGSSKGIKIDSKTRAKMSKGMQARLANTGGMSSSLAGIKSTLSGTNSSLAFTPSQGIELVDPTKLKAQSSSNEGKWFNNGTFTQINEGSTNKLMAPPKRKLQDGEGNESKRRSLN